MDNIWHGVAIFLVIVLVLVGIAVLELTRIYEQMVKGYENDSNTSQSDNTQDDNKLTFEDALIEVDAMYVQAYLNNDNERMKVLNEVLQRLSKIYELHSNSPLDA
jgi:tRNA A37 N6-isopentenylltransferase MiaA